MPEKPASPGSFMRSFAQTNFEGQTCPDDFGFFQFPTINEMYANSVVLGGNFWLMYNDRPEVREWLRWMAGAEAQELMATQETGPFMSPNFNVSADVYAEPCDGAAAAMVANAANVAFDGSDLAPGAIGGDAMFTACQTRSPIPTRSLRSPNSLRMWPIPPTTCRSSLSSLARAVQNGLPSIAHSFAFALTPPPTIEPVRAICTPADSAN